jgi:hypothetical protein
MKTEASTKFKNPENKSLEASDQQKNSEVSTDKKSASKGLSFGNFSTDYKTTAASSYASHRPGEVQRLVSTPGNNIFFGGYKVQMTSTGHSEFSAKKTEKLSKDEMGKIKDHHRNSHFVVGSYESGYDTTSKQYAGEQTEQIKFIPDTKSHVIFGSYKGKEIKKEKTLKNKPFVRNYSQRVSDDRKKKILF